MIFYLSTMTYHGRAPVLPLIPYSIKFIQRGFTERAAFEERIPHVGRGFTVKAKSCLTVAPHVSFHKSLNGYRFNLTLRCAQQKLRDKFNFESYRLTMNHDSLVKKLTNWMARV
jgi:hypothetical protein